MGYRVNYSGVTESMSFEPLPAGSYNVQIEAIENKIATTGRPLVKIRYKVINGEHKDRKIFDQIVIFSGEEKGAGITKHFLHVIDEPYEGDFEIEPKNWVGKNLTITVKIDEQYNNNKIVARELFEDIPF